MGITYMPNGKATIIILIVRLIKKKLLHKMSYFPEPCTRGNITIKAELDLSNCATKLDLNDATGVDILTFAKKGDLTSLKSDIDKLDIYKLERAASGLNSFKSKEIN